MNIINPNDPTAILLLCVAVLSFIILIVHYQMVYMRVPRRYRQQKDNPPQPDHDLPGVSVVLTVHNDAKWLRESLPYLLEQDYPSYEVVVVDFVSQDDTADVLKLCARYYSRLKMVLFQKDINAYRGKKYPLSIGIKSAQHDIILLSEAECVPKDFNWIRRMVEGYTSEKTKIVLGYSGINQKKSLFNALQVFDNLEYHLRYMASALSGRPYTGVSCNLSYRRSFFFDQGAFYNHLTFAQGADDIFVNQNATKENTSVVLAPESFTFTDAQPSLGKWMRMRRDRRATRFTYSLRQRLHLAGYPFVVMCFYASFIALFQLHYAAWQIIVPLVVIEWAWQIFTLHYATKHFGVKRLHWFAPFFEIYFLFANTICALTPLSIKGKRLKRRKKWKNN